jgi:hypothetical protein
MIDGVVSPAPVGWSNWDAPRRIIGIAPALVREASGIAMIRDFSSFSSNRPLRCEVVAVSHEGVIHIIDILPKHVTAMLSKILRINIPTYGHIDQHGTTHQSRHPNFREVSSRARVVAGIS